MFHTCKTFLLAVTVDVVTASFAARSDLNIDQGHSATQVMNSVGAMLEKRGMNAGVLRQVLAKQDPTSEDPLHEILSSVIVDIDTTVITKISDGHLSTQKEIGRRVDDVRRTTAAAVEGKHSADKKDQEWFECVRHEKTLRTHLVEAESRSRTAKSDEGQTCQIKKQEDIMGYSFDIANDDLVFECDFGAAQDSDCSEAYAKYQDQVDVLFETLELDVEDARADFKDAYDNCEDAKQKSVDMQKSQTESDKSWQAQTLKCSAVQENRTLSLCNFGALLQTKCAHLSAYNVLMTSIDQEKGGEYSFPDRVAEFQTAKMTTCMLSKLIAGEVIDEAALAVCEESNSAAAYVEEIGSLDRRETDLADLTSADHFSCKETSITFKGKSWMVEELPANPPSVLSTFNYIAKEDVSEEVTVKEGTDPFSFCAVEPAPCVGKGC